MSLVWDRYFPVAEVTQTPTLGRLTKSLNFQFSDVSQTPIIEFMIGNRPGNRHRRRSVNEDLDMMNMPLQTESSPVHGLYKEDSHS